MTKTRKSRVCGSLYPPTAEGFAKLLAEANRVEGDGYQLVSIVRLESKLASVFRLVEPTEPMGTFFEYE